MSEIRNPVKQPSAIRSEVDAIKVMDFIVHNARMFLSEHHDLKTDSLGENIQQTDSLYFIFRRYSKYN